MNARGVPSAAAAPARRSLAAATASSAARQASVRLGLDREDREHAIAQELQHVAALAAHRLDHRLEIAIERREQLRLVQPLAHAGEAAQVAEQDRRLDVPAVAAPDRPGEHCVRRPVAQKGAQQARARAPHRGRLERRGERLAQALDQLEMRSRQNRPRHRSPGSGPGPSRRHTRAAPPDSRCRQPRPSRAAPDGRAPVQIEQAAAEALAPLDHVLERAADSRRRSRAWSAPPRTRGVSEPSRVQMTPQALASGLASRWPARRRQSGTPNSTSWWQKRSISSSGAEREPRLADQPAGDPGNAIVVGLMIYPVFRSRMGPSGSRKLNVASTSATAAPRPSWP